MSPPNKWLGDKEYDAQPGALVFVPAETWIGLKNTGMENISLVFVWNEPGFEEMMRCASVPKGQVAPPISREGVEECYRRGDADLEIAQPPVNKEPCKAIADHEVTDSISEQSPLFQITVEKQGLSPPISECDLIRPTGNEHYCARALPEIPEARSGLHGVAAENP